MQKANQQRFTVERVIKRKGDKLYVKWNGYDNSFNSGIDKKDIALMSKYFPKPKSLGGIVKVELDLSNYATKSESDVKKRSKSWYIREGWFDYFKIKCWCIRY